MTQIVVDDLRTLIMYQSRFNGWKIRLGTSNIYDFIQTELRKNPSINYVRNIAKK